MRLAVGDPGCPEGERLGALESWSAVVPRMTPASLPRCQEHRLPSLSGGAGWGSGFHRHTGRDAGIAPWAREGAKRASLGGAAPSAGPGKLFCTLQLLGSGRVWMRMKHGWASSLKICPQGGPGICIRTSTS